MLLGLGEGAILVAIRNSAPRIRRTRNYRIKVRVRYGLDHVDYNTINMSWQRLNRIEELP